jgi:DNA invertase Pin-like site-specific DNA recombinase
MNKAIGYTRISAHNYGPEAQLRAIQASLGPETTLVKTFVDRAPAPGQPRPGLEDLLDYLEQYQVDVLVVHRLDRLSRTASELSAQLERLKSRGVTVRTVTDSPSNS